MISPLKMFHCSDSFFTNGHGEIFPIAEPSILILFTVTSPITISLKLNDEELILIPSGSTLIQRLNIGDAFNSIGDEDSYSDSIALILGQRFINNFGLMHLLNETNSISDKRTVRTTSRSSFLIKQIAGLYQGVASPLDQLLLNSRLFELLHCQFSEVLNSANHIQAIHFDKMQLAKRVIHQDLSKLVTIPELAKIVGTNEQYLKKYFKVYYGKTIAQYTIEVKMDQARKLLSDGKLRVTDVSRMVGYKHSTHFTTTFKKHFGFKPTLLK